MTERVSVFRNRLLNTALHLDFLRLRCGSEERFRTGIETVAERNGVKPHVFATLSEWDVVVVLPCQSLYPDVLTSMYATADVASSISGSAGYFAYLWEHEINVDARHDVERKIRRMAEDGVGTLMSLRFDDHIRKELGLAAELLFCDYLKDTLRKHENVDAFVAHTLGWNDVVVLVHTTEDEHRLLSLLATVRLLTVEQLIGPAGMAVAPRLAKIAQNPVFAASYSHLVCSYSRFVKGEMGLGSLAGKIVSATFVVRTIPSLEADARTKIVNICKDLGVEVSTEDMPAEMGHYSFSVQALELARSPQARLLLKLILDIRRYIGDTSGEASESYAETSTRLRFEEPEHTGNAPSHPAPDPELKYELERIRDLLEIVPARLITRGASAMTAHRFNSVLVTLLDNLADPVRSSVVRHLTRFMLSTPSLISELERDDLDDLCHVCEYAVMQATDGIAQFQHDAPSLGLTGRGGYSRLILAMELYMRDLFMLLDVKEIVPLLTFGLRTGGRGSTGRFQTDVSFNTVFVPSSWYVLVHEAGHSAWMSSFGWLGESLVTYEALERLINSTVRDKKELKQQTLVEFIRTREIVRELFANYLVYKVTCGGDVNTFDRLSLHHILASRTGGGTRELLIAVVLHCLLRLTETINAGDWWSNWVRLRRRKHEELVTDAIHSIDTAMKLYIDESIRRAKREKQRGRRERAQQNFIIAKQRLMKTKMFHEVAASALKSVLDVLVLSSREFSRKPGKKSRGAHSAQFATFQQRLEKASKRLHLYDSWRRAGFADWIASGEVLALAPPAWAWSKLLLDSRDELHAKPAGGFLMSQLSVILSLWHRSVTDKPSQPAEQHYNDTLGPLRLVQHVSTSQPERKSRK